MQRLLITGGAGYLGAELMRQASHTPWDVLATIHTHPAPFAAARTIPLDLSQPQQAEQRIADLKPDVIIHTAYRQYDPGLWEVTALGAQAVARAATRSRARLIHMSSDVIFDGERSGSYTEQDPPAPLTPYGAAKAAAEAMVAQAAPMALIVRTSLIYGGSTPASHERLVLEALAQPDQMAFFTDEFRCPIQVGDLARALLELTRLDVHGILNVAGGDAVSRYEFACRIARAHGHAPGALRAARSADSPVRRPRRCVLDCSRASQLLHTRLRGVREVLPDPAEGESVTS